ncbi:hypothetical protein [Mucilaginibacter flavus]|uniref:hypothetical protein n=1 Tax=Mucilaginibacter flavus TaxID=931504 RepID=UPI0025B60C38|nr:hypothetical protein [Mucilaginibacter flavus]
MPAFGLSVVDLLSLDEQAERPVQANAIQAVRERIAEREAEVMQLHRKVIDLYQQLRIAGPRAHQAVAAETFAGSR